MTWYAAHIVMAVEVRDGAQEEFPAWENIVLIAADDDDQAMAKAEARGHADADDPDHSFTWEGRPSRWTFAGVRKLVRCEPDDEAPGDGVEVSYNQVRLASREALERFAAGDAVQVEHDDESPGASCLISTEATP